jgi:hypothetical protein
MSQSEALKSAHWRCLDDPRDDLLARRCHRLRLGRKKFLSAKKLHLEGVNGPGIRHSAGHAIHAHFQVRFADGPLSARLQARPGKRSPAIRALIELAGVGAGRDLQRGGRRA